MVTDFLEAAGHHVANDWIGLYQAIDVFLPSLNPDPVFQFFLATLGRSHCGELLMTRALSCHHQ